MNIMSESLSMTAYPTAAGSVCAAFPLLLAPWLPAAGPGGAAVGGVRTDIPAAAVVATTHMELASSGWS